MAPNGGLLFYILRLQFSRTGKLLNSDRKKWPGWVQMGLWGMSSRRVALIFVGISIALAIASVSYGFINPIAFLGAMFVPAAAWYYLAIRWVDQNDGWQ